MPSLLSLASQALLCSIVVDAGAKCTYDIIVIVIFCSSVSRDALITSREPNVNDIQVSLRRKLAEVIKRLRWLLIKSYCCLATVYKHTGQPKDFYVSHTEATVFYALQQSQLNLWVGLVLKMIIAMVSLWWVQSSNSKNIWCTSSHPKWCSSRSSICTYVKFLQQLYQCWDMYKNLSIGHWNQLDWSTSLWSSEDISCLVINCKFTFDY